MVINEGNTTKTLDEVVVVGYQKYAEDPTGPAKQSQYGRTS